MFVAEQSMKDALPPTLREALDRAGWCWVPSVRDPTGILASLGRILCTGADGAEFRDLRPYSKDKAPYASMSASIGTDAQPRHTDGAFCPCPPRYIALLCLEPGERPCPTDIWPLDLERLRRDRPASLLETVWIARGGGNSPFYCFVMELQCGRVRIRFDPLCMRPVSKCHRTAETVDAVLRGYSSHIAISWERGAMLVIDNWSCTRREPIPSRSSQPCLAFG